MDRWLQWVVVILVVAGIIALIAFARGDFGRDDLPPAAVVTLLA
jgi:hypothetical protein